MPIQYPRGSGPLISVLLPTRGRPEAFCRSVDSLISLAARPQNIELCVKLDEDDQPSIDTYNKIKKILPGPCKAIISPRGRGYFEMHEWITSLSEISTGDWLYLWNDDSLMQTQYYDHIVECQNYADDCCWHGALDVSLLITPTIERPGSYEFFFLRRKVFEILGHWACCPHNDNWLSTVMCFISSAYKIDVFVSHKSDEFKDDVRKDVLEVYKESGKDFNSIKCLRQRTEDVLKLVEYIEKWQLQEKAKKS